MVTEGPTVRRLDPSLLDGHPHPLPTVTPHPPQALCLPENHDQFCEVLKALHRALIDPLQVQAVARSGSG